MKSSRISSLSLLGLLGLCFALTPAVSAQDKPERQQLEAKLRRDQQSILRKSERLRDLMRTLRAQYTREGRTRQVELLDKGLAHLKEMGLLAEVAGVRDALDARALSQANQKAEKVVSDLEALLLILLDRPSMEKIEEQLNKARELEASAAELEQRQSELLQKNRDTSERTLTDAERKLAAELSDLARIQREEAEQTMRDAGTRQPFLESALRRVQALERERALLEAEIAKRRENPDARSPAREQLFDIGALKERTLRQMELRSRQRSMERVRRGAQQLSQATKRQDAAETQDAKDVLRGEMYRAKKSQAADLAESIDDLLKELETAKKTDLDAVAEKIDKKADTAVKAQRDANNEDLDQLANEAAQTAKRFDAARRAQKRQAGQLEKKLAHAAKALRDASDEGKKPGRTQKTLSHLAQALRDLGESRAGVERRNPSNERRAGQMATQAAEAARELRDSPGAKPEADAKRRTESAENKAARKLDDVEQDMRQAAEALERAEKARKDGELPNVEQQRRTDQRLARTEANLEEARRALEAEMRDNGLSEQAKKQAIKRQEQLNRQSQNVRDQLKGSRERGELSARQQQKADQALQKAQQQMRRSQQSVQRNQQSQAAREQRSASEQLTKAREELQRNRPLNAEQKQALKDQAKDQKKLADDIMKLAKLAEERTNQRAQQALERAQEKAAEAADELDQGNDNEAEKKQEEARDALREAQKELEEERERYEDLRQEELLFKIQEELKQFLAKQEPITKKTEAAGAALAKKGRLSRRARRRLNGLSDEEQELQTKAEFMRKALEKEEVLVFSHAIRSSEQDLAEIKKRLAGSRPQPDQVTVVLQKDIEDRTKELISALEREQKRRQKQRKKNREKNQRQKNNQNQRQRLVSITAELEMLKQMEQDMLKRTQFMEKLINARGDDVSDVDLALLERLTHRHNQITDIFLALKKQVEESINPQPEGEDIPDPEKDKGKAPKKKDGGK